MYKIACTQPDYAMELCKRLCFFFFAKNMGQKYRKEMMSGDTYWTETCCPELLAKVKKRLALKQL